jgi:hypothetical protein
MRSARHQPLRPCKAADLGCPSLVRADRPRHCKACQEDEKAGRAPALLGSESRADNGTYALTEGEVPTGPRSGDDA